MSKVLMIDDQTASNSEIHEQRREDRLHENRIPKIEFMSEEDQSDDPVEIQKWIDELRAIPGLPDDPRDDPDWMAWEEKMRLYNVEAVRQQFAQENSL